MKSDIIEKWDPSTWQKTTNNCTLYAGLCAILRPLVTFDELKKLLLMLVDEKDSNGTKKLSEISKHFFNRDESWFRYPTK